MRTDELRARLDDLARDVPPSTRDPIVAVRGRVRRARRRQRLAAGLTVALVLALVVWVLQPSPRHQIVDTGPPPTSSTPHTVPGAASLPEQTVEARLVDATIGWVITDLRVLHTIDGGATWSEAKYAWDRNALANPTPSVSVLDADHAWIAIADAANNRVRVATTVDAGRSLRTTEFTVDHPPRTVSISFRDAANGLLSVRSADPPAPAQLFSTGDGGKTWARVTDTAPAHIWYAGDGVAIGSSPGLQRSDDGGNTWQALHPPGADGAGTVPDAPSYDLVWRDGPRFIVESVLPGGNFETVTYLETRDGGATWKDVTPPSRDLGVVAGTGPKPAMGVVSPGHLRVLTGALPPSTSALLSSDDDGTTWTGAPTNLALSATQLTYANANVAWANAARQCDSASPCQSGMAWSTTDGGLQWFALNPTSIPSSPPQTIPANVDIGPFLDPDHLGPLPNRAIAVQFGGVSTVVLVGLDGKVLGHLDGFDLSPPVWSNPVLPSGGPLTLSRGGRTVVLGGPETDRDLVYLDAPPGAVPLANGAILAPPDATGVVTLTRANGAPQPLERGELAVSADRRWVTTRQHGVSAVARDVETGDTLRFDSDCFVADDTATSLVLLCGDTIKIGRDPATASTFAGPPPNERGHWAAAHISPDGTQLLATFSGECEAISAWIVSLTGTNHRTTLVGPPGTEWDSAGLSWMPPNQMVVYFGPGVCGTALPNGPGVYLVGTDGTLAPIYAVPPDVFAWGATAWVNA